MRPVRRDAGRAPAASRVTARWWIRRVCRSSASRCRWHRSHAPMRNRKGKSWSENLSYRGLGCHGAAYGEVAEDGTMIRKAHVRHLEIGDFDFLADQHEVELDARDSRGERRQVLLVRAAQASRTHEEIDFVGAPEGVEIARDDDRLVRLGDEIVEVSQLILPLPVFQRQVHEEYADIIELEFDDEPLDAGIEVMEAFTLDTWRREKRVALLAHDGHQIVDRALAVFALVGAVVTQRFGDVFGLVQHAAAHRTDVHLDQPDDVRVLFLDEAGDAIEHPAAGTQVSRARERQMESRAGARGVANVVYEQAQAGRC